MGKLPKYFYQRDNVGQICRELLGKILVTNFHDQRTSGRIVECEAYAGITDKASHAYGGRQTARVAPMYAEGGVSYVYLCYGIHHLFNVVTNKIQIPHAILIRAIEPLDGIDIMMQRSPSKAIAALGKGPGKLCQSLGITTKYSGVSLQSKELHLWDDGFIYPDEDIRMSPRIGVNYAAEHAVLPYRLYVHKHPSVSAHQKGEPFTSWISL